MNSSIDAGVTVGFLHGQTETNIEWLQETGGPSCSGLRYPSDDKRNQQPVDIRNFLETLRVVSKPGRNESALKFRGTPNMFFVVSCIELSLLDASGARWRERLQVPFTRHVGSRPRLSNRPRGHSLSHPYQ